MYNAASIDVLLVQFISIISSSQIVVGVNAIVPIGRQRSVAVLISVGTEIGA